MTEQDLGKLEAVYGISPAFMQRAAIVAVVSFVFFLLMLFAFSLRQNIGYFLLATAFLIIQLLTLFGWIMQKRSLFKLYENGFSYKNHVCRWHEIESINLKAGNNSTGCEIKKANGEQIVLSNAIHGAETIVRRIQAELGKRR